MFVPTLTSAAMRSTWQGRAGSLPGFSKLLHRARHGAQTYLTAWKVEGGAEANLPWMRDGTVQHQLILKQVHGTQVQVQAHDYSRMVQSKLKKPRSWLVHVAKTRGHVLAIGHV